ncbi:MAG: SCO family protein [Casimicrobiaceae bacterium]
MKALSMCVFAVAMAAMPPAIASPEVPLPADSVYQASIELTDAQSRHFAWGEKRGQPQLVSMFYTSCTFSCPMLVEAAKVVRQSLTADERARLGVTLISLDPKRDTPQVLARMQKARSIGEVNWTLARPAPRDVRKIAGLLGVRYRALADGDFNHTTVLVLLDAEGRVVARTEQLGGVPDPTFLAVLRGTLAGH